MPRETHYDTEANRDYDRDRERRVQNEGDGYDDTRSSRGRRALLPDREDRQLYTDETYVSRRDDYERPPSANMRNQRIRSDNSDDGSRERFSNEGLHRGKGPKDYRRSDERIREDTCDRLADDGNLDASQIEVSVKDAEVTLNGQVDSRNAKRRAEDCVDSVSGVTHCQNNLRVRATDEATSEPASRNRSAKSKLATS